MSEQIGGSPSADWYPDPQDPEQLRYWDGQSWSEHRAPAVTGLSSIGDWITDTFSAIGRCWKDLAILSVIFALPFALMNGAALVWAAGDIEFIDLDTNSPDVIGFDAGRFALVGLLWLVSMVVGLLYANAVRHRVYWAVRKQDTTWQRSAAVGLKRAPLRLLWGIVWLLVFMVPLIIYGVVLGLVIGFVGAGLATAVGLLGGLALLVAIPWLWARMSMMFTAIAVGGSSPLSTSFKLTKPHVWTLLLRLFLWAIAMSVLGSVFSAPQQLAFGGFDFTGMEEADSLRVSDFLGDAGTGLFVFGSLVAAAGGALTRAATAGAEALIYRQLEGPADGAP